MTIVGQTLCRCYDNDRQRSVNMMDVNECPTSVILRTPENLVMSYLQC